MALEIMILEAVDNQQISAWDTIHPGRQWALKLQKGKSEEEIVRQIITFLRNI
jgi:hypothetical protein